MSLQFKKVIPFINALFLVFFLVSSYMIYKNEVYLLKERIHNKLYLGLEHFKEYFIVSQTQLFSMKYTIEDKFQLNSTCIHPSFKDLVYKKYKNIYQIKKIKGIKDKSILSGIGKPSSFSQELIDEINASLYLKTLFFAAEDIIPDFKKIYYTSKNNFIYSSKKEGFKDENDFQKLYNYKSWFNLEKNNYKDVQLNVTNLYRDYRTKELLISLSLPVFHNDVFKGLVSIDVGIDKLSSFLNRLNLKGQTYLVDENNTIIASQSPFKLGNKIKQTNANTIMLPIIDNQLYLIHRIDEYELRRSASIQGSGKIFILLLLIIISIMFLYLKALTIKLQHLANTDALTGLLNRRAMEYAINRQIKISRRYKEPLSFLLVDIDYFKSFNDNYGHDVGDEVLIKISNLFRYLIRSCDIVSRLGGEEFLLSLANTDLNESYILAERVRKLVNEIKINQKNLNITVSIGCITLKKNDDLKSILKRADEMMYKAKAEGRNNTKKEEED